MFWGILLSRGLSGLAERDLAGTEKRNSAGAKLTVLPILRFYLMLSLGGKWLYVGSVGSAPVFTDKFRGTHSNNGSVPMYPQADDSDSGPLTLGYSPPHQAASHYAA